MTTLQELGADSCKSNHFDTVRSIVDKLTPINKSSFKQAKKQFSNWTTHLY